MLSLDNINFVYEPHTSHSGNIRVTDKVKRQRLEHMKKHWEACKIKHSILRRETDMEDLAVQYGYKTIKKNYFLLL